MKINIGPYINWFGTYHIGERLQQLGLSEERSDKFAEFLRNHTPVERICTWIFERRKRKVKVKLDRYDTWNADHTLSLIIVPMLEQLKATKHGAPFTDDSDVPEHLRSTNSPPKENEWDTDAFHFIRWDWILDEMIWAFNRRLEENEEVELVSEEDNKRMANGFRLFGRYFRNLWD